MINGRRREIETDVGALLALGRSDEDAIAHDDEFLGIGHDGT
jgi:hypothetical protein